MNNWDFVYSKEIDFAPPETIRRGRTELLRKHLAYCAEHSPYYRKLFGKRDFSGFELSDLKDLPLTSKKDLSRENESFFAAPENEIQDIVFSSGTTGKPSMIAYTGNDMRRLAYNEHRCFAAAGMTEKNRVLLTCTLDRCFVAGLAYYLGVRSIGAAAVRNGLNTLESHAEVMERIRPDVIVGVPSFLRRLGEFLKERGTEPVGVGKLICIGEPVREEDFTLSPLGKELKKLWRGASVHSTYASSEIVTSFCDCAAENGGHLIWDLAIAEIVDDAGKVLPPGEVGNLAVTPLRTTGTPLVRFLTGDVTFLSETPCSCGRHTPRLGPILGRRAQMLKVRGTTLYPQSLYSVLDPMEEIAEYYLEASGEGLSDRITVVAALRDPSAGMEIPEAKLRARCRLNIPVRVVSAEEIHAKIFGSGRKPVRFVDLRKK